MLLQCTDCAANNGSKSTPALTADLLGDWREVYRAQVSFEQSAYNQPPHVGFHIGAGMADPPVPDIRVVKRRIVFNGDPRCFFYFGSLRLRALGLELCGSNAISIAGDRSAAAAASRAAASAALRVAARANTSAK